MNQQEISMALRREPMGAMPLACVSMPVESTTRNSNIAGQLIIEEPLIRFTQLHFTKASNLA